MLINKLPIKSINDLAKYMVNINYDDVTSDDEYLIKTPQEVVKYTFRHLL